MLYTFTVIKLPKYAYYTYRIFYKIIIFIVSLIVEVVRLFIVISLLHIKSFFWEPYFWAALYGRDLWATVEPHVTRVWTVIKRNAKSFFIFIIRFPTGLIWELYTFPHFLCHVLVICFERFWNFFFKAIDNPLIESILRDLYLAIYNAFSKPLMAYKRVYYIINQYVTMYLATFTFIFISCLPREFRNAHRNYWFSDYSEYDYWGVWFFPALRDWAYRVFMVEKFLKSLTYAWGLINIISLVYYSALVYYYGVISGPTRLFILKVYRFLLVEASFIWSDLIDDYPTFEYILNRYHGARHALFPRVPIVYLVDYREPMTIYIAKYSRFYKTYSSLNQERIPRSRFSLPCNNTTHDGSNKTSEGANKSDTTCNVSNKTSDVSEKSHSVSSTPTDSTSYGDRPGLQYMWMVLFATIPTILFLLTSLNQFPNLRLDIITPFKLNDSLYMPLVFLIDDLSLKFATTTLIIGAVAITFSHQYMRGEPYRFKFLVLLCSFLVSMLLLLLSGNLVTLFLGWELIGITSFLLIAFWSTRSTSFKAASKALLFNQISDAALIGFLIITNSQRSNSVLQPFDYITALEFTNYQIALLVICICCKSAQFPLHFWLPDSMEAPVPASALIHSATLVSAGLYLVLRLNMIHAYSDTFRSVLIVLGLITAFVGGLSSIFQSDLKRMLAYSTISNCGLMILFSVTCPQDMTVAYFILHGVTKALSFVCIGTLVIVTGHKQDIRYFREFNQNKYTFVLLLTIMLSQLGAWPATVLSYVKHANTFSLAIFGNSVVVGQVAVSVVFLVAVMSIIYTIKTIYIVLSRPSTKHNATFCKHHTTFELINIVQGSLVLAMALLASTIIVINYLDGLCRLYFLSTELIVYLLIPKLSALLGIVIAPLLIRLYSGSLDPAFALTVIILLSSAV